MAQALAHVRKYPGCTIRECVEAIEHHYPSNRAAQSSFAKYATMGVLEFRGIRTERDGRRYRLYPVEPEVRPEEGTTPWNIEEKHAQRVREVGHE